MPTDRRDDDNKSGGLLNRHEAFHHFATFYGPTQSQQHIKPLHRYVTTRIVLGGGLLEGSALPPYRSPNQTSRVGQKKSLAMAQR